MAVIAKFYVSEVKDSFSQNPDGRVDAKQVSLQAVYGNGEENKEWSKWTPNGRIEMTITNPNAYNQFKGGQYVFVTFEPLESAEGVK